MGSERDTTKARSRARQSWPSMGAQGSIGRSAHSCDIDAINTPVRAHEQHIE